MTKLSNGQNVLLLEPLDRSIAQDAAHFLPEGHAAVMETLWSHGRHGLTVREVCGYLEDEEYSDIPVTISTVGTMLRALLKKKLVRRNPDPLDRGRHLYFAKTTPEELMRHSISKALEALARLNPDLVEREVDRIIGGMKYRSPGTIHAGVYGEKRNPALAIAPEEDES